MISDITQCGRQLYLPVVNDLQYIVRHDMHIGNYSSPQMLPSVVDD